MSPPRDDIEKSRYPAADVDLTGRVKLRTLEFFLYNPGWRSPKDLKSNTDFTEWEDLVPRSNAVEMRFLRYTRAGLLNRKRARRGYMYEVNTKGEKRWLFLVKKFGLLDSRDSVKEKWRSPTRIDMAKTLLQKHRQELQEELQAHDQVGQRPR